MDSHRNTAPTTIGRLSVVARYPAVPVVCTWSYLQNVITFSATCGLSVSCSVWLDKTGPRPRAAVRRRGSRRRAGIERRSNRSLDDRVCVVRWNSQLYRSTEQLIIPPDTRYRWYLSRLPSTGILPARGWYKNSEATVHLRTRRQLWDQISHTQVHRTANEVSRFTGRERSERPAFGF